MAEKNNFRSLLKKLEDGLDLYLNKKAPQLPDSWKEFLVKLAPYLSIIGVILGIPAVLALFGLGTVAVPFGTLGGMLTGRPFLGIQYLVNTTFLAIVIVLEALAISPLFKRASKGWRYLYYAALVSGVQNILNANVGGLVIGTLLSLYVLFQVKSYYK